ncbi:hypothetical protein LEP1GSC013_3078 [Leptospira interrogans serovar Valbuzzi str. Duyster]|nr:hypothetical protein LEP1GSC013_3078 [Leptospira interrogans serovar Valbuzzi str. Duyster]ENO71421.1 hypothetical protein LEP1GSC012_3955 [Leptospira interrogans serovar Valbuzzi str. Valbuzzi]
MILEEFRSNLNPKLADQENFSGLGEDHLQKFRNPIVNTMAKRNFAGAFAQCRCFQNVVIAFKGIDDVDLLRKKYKNAIRIKLVEYTNNDAFFITTLV